MAPIVISSPKALASRAGSTVTLKVEVAAVPTSEIEWRRDGKGIKDDGRVRGSHTQTLEIASFQRADIGRYVAVATNASGRAESEPATITMTTE